MPQFVNPSRQGELTFSLATEIPADAKPANEKNLVGAMLVIGHSETGHHHGFMKHDGVTFYETQNPFIGYLKIDTGAELVHMRDFATHQTVTFGPGLYEVRKPREYISPEEARMVAD